MKAIVVILSILIAGPLAVITPPVAWKQIATPPTEWEGYVIATDLRGKLYLGAGYHVYSSSDRGASWQDMSAGLPAGEIVTALAVNQYGQPVCGAGLHTNRIRGVGRAFFYSSGQWRPAGGLSASGKVSAFAVASNGDVFAVTAWNGDVWRSSNGGASYSLAARNVLGGGALWSIAANGSTLVCGGEGDGIYRSQDLGATWQKFGLSNEEGYRGNIRCITFAPDGTLYASRQYHATGEPFHRFRNGRWSIVSKGIPMWELPTALAVDRNGVVYASTFRSKDESGRVFRSKDQGASWESIGDGLDGYNATSITPDLSGVYLTRFHGGVYRL